MNAPYFDGYEHGLKDGYGNTGQAAEAAAIVQQVEETLDLVQPYELSDWWLGYYHGRYHARNGRPPRGSERRAQRN